MSFLTKVEAQALSNNQNELGAIFQTVNTAIKTATGLGDYSAVYTLTGGDITLGPKIVDFFTLQGFTVALSGASSEVVTVSWDS